MSETIAEIKRRHEAAEKDTGYEWAGLYADDAHADRATLLRALGEAQARAERAEAAASGLEKAVGGLSIAEIEIREAIGNTNWNVIQHWREKVRAAQTLKERNDG